MSGTLSWTSMLSLLRIKGMRERKCGVMGRFEKCNSTEI